MKIDLHNHTNFSDGVYSPSELVERAIKNNVDIFALTDHDSVFGCEEIYECTLGKNVRVIKGLELSCYYDNESVHIICLFKNNIVPKEMYDFSNELVIKRKQRAIDMMNNIHKIYGVNIDMDALMNGSKIITRGNMLRNILENNDIEYDYAQFLISNKSEAYIPSTKMSVEDGIALARNANCFVIFAHPCLLKKQENVEKIIQLGVDALEVRYPSSKNDEEYYTSLAKKYNLLISAGSDCHGDVNPDHGEIGTCTINEEEFKPIAQILNFTI